MQLVAYGAQDIYFTGNPQITFFKVVYRRHTNFSMEAISQSFNGQAKVGASSNQASATISRNGDLIHKMYVTVDGSNASNIIDGSKIVKEAELEIGGQKIDRHYEEWNNIWNELSTTGSKASGLKCMQGCVGNDGVGAIGKTGPGMVQVPLLFWFCRNPGLALPLIALQYHEVKVLLTTGIRDEVLGTSWGSTTDLTVNLFVDYIYLDTDERRRFAQVSHEYLIEQVQKQAATTDSSQKLVFNHPVKELIWTSAGGSDTDYDTAQLKLNGHDRFSTQNSEYFQLRQPFDYHTAVPGQNIVAKGTPTIALAADGAPIVGTLTANPDGSTLSLSAPHILLFKVGDVVLVECQKTDAEGSAGSTSTITTVTAASGTTLTTDPVVSAIDVSSSGSGKVSIIARAQNPVCRTSKMTKKINVYSFALKPEEHQPSGTCNFSRIDTAILEVSGGDKLTTNHNIYAVNYNVLRIMSGMGGLAYSN